MAGVENRVAMVTGGGRGIGLATANLLAERGAKVVCVARSEAELKATGHGYVVADLASPEGCEKAVQDAESNVGPIDILVCNHGLGSAHEVVIWEQEIKTWETTMHINLDAPFYLSRLVTKGMVKRRHGRVVFTSSTAAKVAEYAGSAYNSSKAGLLGLMQSVAEDCGEFGITSNAVLPGWVRTEMAEKHAAAEALERDVSTEQVWQERAALYRAGRVATPDEVSGVSGEAIRVSLGGVM
jgi:NAD(P)-dependent dehydrogenase (short-subunit alcohol dehydrogenase family)